MPKPAEPVRRYHYFDTPDGYDIFPKLGCMIKPMAVTSFALSTVDVFLYSKPKSYLQVMARYFYFTWPVVGATTAFVITHNLAASIRKKDDKLNWFLGGATTGGVWGVWRKTTVGGICMGLAVGFGAIIYKYSLQCNYDLFPEAKVQYGNLWSARQDWTITAHRPGNWTTGKD